MIQNGKKMVNYKLYMAKKEKSPDYLCKMINHNKENNEYLDAIGT